MANQLTTSDINLLRSADQRFRAYLAIFPAATLVVTAATPGSGTLLAPKPMPLVSPRYSVVNNSGSITLYATNSFNRGGAYVGDANISWANTGGLGSLVDNSDGTATYTAPASGSGTNLITMTATNSNGSKSAKVYVAYPKNYYDGIVAEMGVIQGSVRAHGWEWTLKCKGDSAKLADLVVGKSVLLHVEDTWNGTTSNVGAFEFYEEGTFHGIITGLEYFEDWSGDAWLGVKLRSSWYLLEQVEIGETYWGTTSASGKFFRGDFRPTDALWHILSELTDYASYHNVTLFEDDNVIDDLFIGKGTDAEVSLAAIIEDVLAREMAIAYTDKYSSLLCVPDPDVRASLWWGTPSPIYNNTDGRALNGTDTLGYGITRYDYPRVKKLTLAAFDSSKLGIYAISYASAGTTQGRSETIRGLLCDDVLRLVGWARDKRAQMNRQWDMTVDLPLNHTVDLSTFVDVNFTAPSLPSGLTASGRTWIDQITYRPQLADGTWRGSWRLLQNTSGNGASETGATSAWGGSGQYSSLGQVSGQGMGSGTGGWQTGTGGASAWCYFFDFANSGTQGFAFLDETTDNGAAPGLTGTRGEHGGSGFKTTTVISEPTDTGLMIDVRRYFDSRLITQAIVWASGTGSGTHPQQLLQATFWHGVFGAPPNNDTAIPATPLINQQVEYSWAGAVSASAFEIYVKLFQGPGEDYNDFSAVVPSAQLGGLGTNPFGEDNCP